MKSQWLGRQLILEIWEADPKLLDDVDGLRALLLQAAREAKATVVDVTFHRFTPYGVSGVVVVAESHLTIHTWPEHGYAAVDVFTCGEQMDLQAAARTILQGLKGHAVQVELHRGLRSHEAHATRSAQSVAQGS